MGWLPAILILLAIIFVAVLAWMDYQGRTGTMGRTCTDGCVDPYICDSSTQTCRLKPGSRCSQDSDCTSNAKCHGTVCMLNSQQPTIVPITTLTPPPSNSSNNCPCNSSTTTSSISYSDKQSYSSRKSEYDSESYSSRKSEYDSESYSSRKSEYDSESYSSRKSYTSPDSESYSSRKSEYDSDKHKSEYDTINTKYHDIITHNGDKIILHDQYITIEGRKSHIVKFSDELISLYSFTGKIFAINSDNQLLKLKMSTYDGFRWIFKPTGIENVEHVSLTGEYLLVQFDTESGKLYDSELKVVENVVVNGRRYYSSDRNIYADLDTQGNVKVSNYGKFSTYSGINAMVFTDNNSISVSRDSRVRKIVMVDGAPVYLG